MNLNKILTAHLKYGTTLEDLKENSFFKECFENIVIAPMWKVDVLNIDPKYIKKINNLVYNVELENCKFSFITIGMMGATNIMDKLLELALFKPKQIIFVGSASSLDLNINIGDTVVIRNSYCGEGASRYLNENLEDDFGKCLSPSKSLNNKLKEVLKKYNIPFYYVDAFSADTIFVQFNHLDHIKKLGCKILEMETYVTFKVCALCGINASALINISDSCAHNKTLYSGRSLEEKMARNKHRSEVITKAILDLFTY